MRNFYYIIALFTTLLISCSYDEPFLSDEQPIESNNIYLEFNKWVYSQMNQKYLWRDELPDSVECDYELAPKEFFNSLISPNDRFSYFTTNPSYQSRISTKNVGFAYQLFSDIKGNEAMYVLYVNSLSAKNIGLHRGDFIKIKNITNSSVSLSRIHYADETFFDNGETMDYNVQKFGDKANTVLLDTIFKRNKNIGYICYLEYGEVNDLIEPLKKFKQYGISDLILDLRYNPGGYVSTCKFLCNCIVPPKGYGSVYQQCSYNNILTNYYKRTTGNGRTFSRFEYPTTSSNETLGATILGLNLKRIFVITSKHTASASEATIVCLRPYMDVVIIGETTVGKGVGSWKISDSKYKYEIQPITMRYYNAQGESTPDEGLTPNYIISDGYTTNKKELGDINEPLLNQALRLICPETFKSSKTSRSISVDNQNLKPIGNPSYIQEFNNKNYRYEN